MASTIQQKRSTTGGNSPTLSAGEIAVQLVDKRIFSANATVVFDAFQNTVSNIAITNATGQYSVGNSTVNAIINSTSFAIANSTVSLVIVKPTAAEVSAVKVLSAAGTWVLPTGNPGGSNTYVQINDSGALAGFAGFTFDKTTNVVSISGNLSVNTDIVTIGNSSVNTVINSTSILIGNSFVNTTVIAQGGSTTNTFINSVALVLPNGAGVNAIPTPAAANTVAFYGKYKARRLIGGMIDGSGWDQTFDPHDMHNSVCFTFPQLNATTLSQQKLPGNTTLGTAVGRAMSTANAFQMATRLGCPTSAIAGNSFSLRMQNLQFWRGNGAGLGGFYIVTRFGCAINVSNGRYFFGLLNVTSLPANGEPTALTNMIGFGKNAGASNVFAMSANSTAANSIDLGIDATTGNTNWYEGIIYAQPNGGTVSYQITNLANNFTVTGDFNQTNLPSNTSLLAFHVWVNNGTTASAYHMDWGGFMADTGGTVG